MSASCVHVCGLCSCLRPEFMSSSCVHVFALCSCLCPVFMSSSCVQVFVVCSVLRPVFMFSSVIISSSCVMSSSCVHVFVPCSCVRPVFTWSCIMSSSCDFFVLCYVFVLCSCFCPVFTCPSCVHVVMWSCLRPVFMFLSCVHVFIVSSSCVHVFLTCVHVLVLCSCFRLVFTWSCGHFKEDCRALPLSTILEAIDGATSLALCPQVVSLAPRHFRFSETQASCGCSFARQSVYSVISCDSGIYRTILPQVSEGGCRPFPYSILASHSTFHFLSQVH